jgi:hypothetical protein
VSVEAISWALNLAPDGTGAFPSVATLVRYTGRIGGQAGTQAGNAAPPPRPLAGNPPCHPGRVMVLAGRLR